jgi:hypothetical protein
MHVDYVVTLSDHLVSQQYNQSLESVSGPELPWLICPVGKSACNAIIW